MLCCSWPTGCKSRASSSALRRSATKMAGDLLDWPALASCRRAHFFTPRIKSPIFLAPACRRDHPRKAFICGCTSCPMRPRRRESRKDHKTWFGCVSIRRFLCRAREPEGIVIGKGGLTIKAIGEAARHEMKNCSVAGYICFSTGVSEHWGDIASITANGVWNSRRINERGDIPRLMNFAHSEWMRVKTLTTPMPC